jgi:hypothetical protein
MEFTEDAEIKINANETDLVILSMPKNLFKMENAVLIYLSDGIGKIYKIKFPRSFCYPVQLRNTHHARRSTKYLTQR